MAIRRFAALALVVFVTFGAAASVKVRNLAGQLVEPLAASPPGKPVSPPTTQAFGCFIGDMK